jgi:hypothetical protein
MPLTAEELRQLGPALAPHGIYVEGDDYLLASVINTVASVAIVIGGRMVMPTGRAKPFQDRLVATSDRVAATKAISLGDGWLQEITAIVSGAAPIIGQTFVRVDLVRGEGAGRNVHATLVQGPVTAFHRVAWPGTPVQTTIGLPGALRSLTGTDPAANTEIQETVPTGARWRLISLRAALVTDANAANREVAITFDDGTTVYAEAHAGANQAASLTRQYAAARGGVRGAAATGTGILIAIPEIVLPAAHRINTATTNRQAGDNWGAPQLLVEEWLEGA